MPLGPGIRYRMGPHGVRLAFKGNTVVEAKNMKTGDTSTPGMRKQKPRRGTLLHGGKD